MYTASLTAFSQWYAGSLLWTSAARAEFMIVLLIRSAMAFSCGVYGVVGRNWMPLCARYCVTYFDVYSFALSVVIVAGYCVLCCAISSIVVVSAVGTCERVASAAMNA